MMVQAYPGQVARYGQALSKNSCEVLATSKPLKAGLFVAYAERGVKELEDERDVIAGVIVRSLLTDEFKNGDPVDVMQIGTGDSIWVQAVDSSSIKHGDLVVVIPTGENSGKVTKDPGGKHYDTYVALDVAEGLVKITKQ